MIDALIAGKLHGAAQQKTSKAGKPFTTAKVRVAMGGEGEATFVSVVAFNDDIQAALMALGDGDAVALAGTLKPTAWIDREGAARAGLDMVAAQVLTTYHVSRKRKAMHPEHDGRHEQRPTQDAWKAAAPAGRGQREHRPADDLDDGCDLPF